jgi:hypothetical protein
MSHVLRLKGARGALLVGYREAAKLTGGALTPVEDKDGKIRPLAWIFTASIVERDPFLMSQQIARDVRLDVGGQFGRWVWRGVELEIDGDSVRGTLSGRPEVR